MRVDPSSLRLRGVCIPVVRVESLISFLPGVEPTDVASFDFVELAGVGRDCRPDRRGGILAAAYVVRYNGIATMARMTWRCWIVGKADV
jgi:hypothetical protein